jgi:hypothetical protein
MPAKFCIRPLGNIIMKKILLISILAFLFNATYSQTSIKLEKGEKLIELDQNAELIFLEKEIKPNGDSIINTYDGQLSNITQDSITITPSGKHVNTFFTDKRSLQNDLYFINDTTSKITFGMNHLYQINTFNSSINETTTYISIISAVTALIVSPLVSFNFKKKTFDTNKYSYITGISLATFTVSLTINFAFSYKKFSLQGDKKVWRIIK